MSKKVLAAVSLGTAIFVGVALAAHHPSDVLASTETLLLKAGTFASNDHFCFGDAGGDNGWHGPNETAADV